ncbi:MAG: GNAT family N-acetyltransferase [Devosiaceae bacterium]|nr:GNAT family N-acetyltransferase [Devosiaceae bacterium MH13]
MADTVIRTQRLVLRRAKLEDAAALFAAFNDPEAMAYWDSLPHTKLAQTERFVRHLVAADDAVTDDFVVEYEGAVIGKAGFWRMPEIGFILRRDMWGQGLAREAVAALIARAFEHHGLPEIIADIDPRNERSRRLLTALGFVQTRFAHKNLKVGDTWVDTAYLTLRNPNQP